MSKVKFRRLVPKKEKGVPFDDPRISTLVGRDRRDTDREMSWWTRNYVVRMKGLLFPRWHVVKRFQEGPPLTGLVGYLRKEKAIRSALSSLQKSADEGSIGEIVDTDEITRHLKEVG